MRRAGRARFDSARATWFPGIKAVRLREPGASAVPALWTTNKDPRFAPSD